MMTFNDFFIIIFFNSKNKYWGYVLSLLNF